MDEEMKEAVIRKLNKLHYITDDILYVNHSPESLKEELDSIDALISKLENA